MKKFSIIIPCYKNTNELSRCIESCLDQNWKNKEIIVVLDGYDSSAETILNGFKDVKWFVTEKEASGAPRARNIGAKHATGDYLLFLDADSIIYPGSLREWAEAFEENSWADFVYGGYKITGSDSYPSQEFDPYFLEINNYIDTSNPLKKKVYKPWDESLKGLQDWDFWLRIVKNGSKGYYLKNQYFVEKLPPNGSSISARSHKNWLETKSTVQEKLGLKKRNVCLTSFAAIHHAKRCAKLMQFDYADPFFLFSKPHDYKAIYIIGFFPANQSNLLPFMDSATNPPLINKKIKKIIHWIGSDILQLRTAPIAHDALAQYVDSLNSKFIQYCQTEDNRKELERIGIKAKVCPLPVDVQHKDIPMPKTFTVGIYDHNTNDIYCQPLMLDVILAMPDIKFVYFGAERLVGKPSDVKNLEYLGRMPIDDVISRVSVLLRITKHDGFPVSPVEFLCANRVSISNQKCAFTETIDLPMLTETDLVNMKKEILKRIRKVKKDYPKKEFFDNAIDYYHKELNPKRLRNEILSCL